MNLFELSATLGLDTSGFGIGITNAMGMLTGLTDFAEKTFAWLANAALDFGKDVMQTGMGFDQAMSNVRAVLGSAEGTMENMEELRAFALDQAKDSIFTAEETADAYYYMGMAGWKSEQMTKGLPGIMALAAASGEDLARVSDIVTDSLTAFGKGADYTSKYVDILAQTATNSNTDVSRMGETFKYVAPIAGSLGYNVEDVAITIGMLADAGIKGSMAGTTLRNIFTRIGTNAGATQKDLGALQIMTDKLGVSFYDSEGKVRPWLDVMTEARKSWQGLSESEMQDVAAAFGTINSETAESTDLLTQFDEDLKGINETITSLNTRAKKDTEGRAADVEKLQHYYSSYKGLLERLGVNIADIESGHLSLSDAFDQARIKLGGLSDQESIYYSKQIASMRGMSGWLSLMNMSDEEVQKLTESIQNATGAAQTMADTRMGSLAGDVDRLTSAFDILKIAVYDDVKGPMREIVQWVTGAINDITNAINENGLLGGIEMLGTKIEEAGEKFKPMLESIGKAAAPMIEALITDIAPSIEAAGISLAGGLLKGFSDGLMDTNVKALSNIGGVLSFGTSLADKLIGGGGFFKSFFGKVTVPKLKVDDLFDIGGNPIPVDIIPTLKPQDIYNAVSTAIENNEQNILIGDKFWVDNDTALRIANQLQAGIDGSGLYDSITDNATAALSDAGTDGGKSMMDNVAEEVAKSVGDGVGKPTRAALSDAGTTGGADMTSNITDQANTAAPGIADIFSSFIGDSGDPAGSIFSSLFGSVLDSESWGMADSLATSLGNAGDGAGWDIADSIQRILSWTRFTVSVVGFISDLVGSFTHHNASAMSSGRIYTRPTAFGYYDNNLQVAGDAGPEAVVGVNSLQRMITNAVRSAGAGGQVIIPRDQGRDMTIILELDRQQFGKAVYKANNDETQRVGVRMATGGAY